MQYANIKNIMFNWSAVDSWCVFKLVCVVLCEKYKCGFQGIFPQIKMYELLYIGPIFNVHHVCFMHFHSSLTHYLHVFTQFHAFFYLHIFFNNATCFSFILILPLCMKFLQFSLWLFSYEVCKRVFIYKEMSRFIIKFEVLTKHDKFQYCRFNRTAILVYFIYSRYHNMDRNYCFFTNGCPPSFFLYFVYRG